MILGSWQIRGPAQPIRFLLEYIGKPYIDKMYEMGDAPNFDKTKWTSVRNILGFDK